jgi:hypothetical protein
LITLLLQGVVEVVPTEVVVGVRAATAHLLVHQVAVHPLKQHCL